MIRVVIVYNEFKNVATQILRAEQMLPVIAPKEDKKAQEVDYIYQPNREEIISGLIPKSLKMQLYKAVLDSECGGEWCTYDGDGQGHGECW